MVRGWVDYIVLDEQNIMDRDWSLDIKGLNFEFFLVLNHFDGDLGTTQRWSSWERIFIFKHIVLE
jgi:hypothetical protein